MNIIYMHTHDTGRYIEPYGCQVPTPNLMKLAREGTVFRNAYCAGPTCSPSRSGLLTGMAPHSCGMTGLAHRGFQLNDYSRHLVQFLNRNQYETVLSGFQHEAPDRNMIGYKTILQEASSPQKTDDRSEWDIGNARKAADYICQAGDRPFFLSFGMVNTHRPYPAIDPEVNPDYVMLPFPIFDNEENRKDMAAYISSAKVADQCVGIILDALRESGKEDDTLVIFTTDHGIAFPMMKCQLYDAGIGVALLLKFPGNKKAGKAVDWLVSHLDIFPTICEMIGAEQPDWLQGESMMPLFEEQSEKIREVIFSEVTFHSAYDPMRCVRSERYKYIRIFSKHGRYVHLGGDGGITTKFFQEYGSNNMRRETEMLYDLYLDPVERVNLVKEPEYQAVYERMKGYLQDWMIQTDDPLLAGDVLPPAGARLSSLTRSNPMIQEGGA
jgi:N-sulfoglucosamine sulfohydrolase